MIENGVVHSKTLSVEDSQHLYFMGDLGISGKVDNFRNAIDDISRPWKSRKTKSFDWCRADSSRNKDEIDNPLPGLIYIKIDKAASSSLAGINIRLAHKVGAKVLPPRKTNLHLSQVCSHTYTHGRASDIIRSLDGDNINNSLPTTTPSLSRPPHLLWTFLRDPVRRAVSEYYHFWVSRRGYGVKNGLVKPFLESRKNFQLLYVLDQKYPEQVLARAATATNTTTTSNTDIRRNDITTGTIVPPPPVWQLIQDHIINVYDFIGLVERMEESLAVMKLLWGVDSQDLIVLSAKQSGGWDDGRHNDTCYQIHPSYSQGDDASGGKNALSPYLQHYIQTDYRVGNFDYQLYDLVNASLDKTIAYLGHTNVERTRQEIRQLQSLVELKCQDEAVFPCSKNGTRQHDVSRKNCYWFDSGCGFPCVDRVLNERNNNS